MQPARWRRIAVPTLTVLAALLLLFASANTWVKRQLLDTDRWVATTDELLANDEIRGGLSRFIVDELYASVDVGERLDEQLPDALQGLGTAIAAGLRGPAVETVDRLLATDTAQQIWSTANELTHETLVGVLRDETRADAVSTAGGVVTLDLRQIVVQLAETIGLPESVTSRIPQDAGVITVVESDELDAAQRAVQLIEWASVVLFVAVVGLFAAAVALADGWRRVAVRNIGLAVFVVGVLLLLAHRLGRSYVLDNLVAVDANRGVASETWWIGTSLFRSVAWSEIVIGALIVAGAWLVGPARAAVWSRVRLGPAFDTSPGVAWTASAVAIVALVVVTPPEVFATWLGVLLTVLVLFAAVFAFQHVARRERTDGTDGHPDTADSRGTDGTDGHPDTADSRGTDGTATTGIADAAASASPGSR